MESFLPYFIRLATFSTWCYHLPIKRMRHESRSELYQANTSCIDQYNPSHTALLLSRVDICQSTPQSAACRNDNNNDVDSKPYAHSNTLVIAYRDVNSIWRRLDQDPDDHTHAYANPIANANGNPDEHTNENTYQHSYSDIYIGTIFHADSSPYQYFIADRYSFTKRDDAVHTNAHRYVRT